MGIGDKVRPLLSDAGWTQSESQQDKNADLPRNSPGSGPFVAGREIEIEFHFHLEIEIEIHFQLDVKC
jgi:hypothetical protein